MICWVASAFELVESQLFTPSEFGAALSRLIQWLLDDGVVPLEVLAHLLDPASVLVRALPVDKGDAEG